MALYSIDRNGAMVNFALPFVEWHLRSTVCSALAARANFRSEICAVVIAGSNRLDRFRIIVICIL